MVGVGLWELLGSRSSWDKKKKEKRKKKKEKKVKKKKKKEYSGFGLWVLLLVEKRKVGMALTRSSFLIDRSLVTPTHPGTGLVQGQDECLGCRGVPEIGVAGPEHTPLTSLVGDFLEDENLLLLHF